MMNWYGQNISVRYWRKEWTSIHWEKALDASFQENYISGVVSMTSNPVEETKRGPQLRTGRSSIEDRGLGD